MQLELNLWFSEKTGNIFGNLNINQKEEVQNIVKLMPINEFCNFTKKKRIVTDEILSDFVNDPRFDHSSMFGWTDKNNLVIWKDSNQFIDVVFNGDLLKLQRGALRKFYKGMPDMYFRG